MANVAIGTPVPLIGVVRASVLAGVIGALMMFAFSLLHLLLLARVIVGLTRWLGGEPDTTGAMKVAAYSFTPVWLGGVLYAVPALSMLWVIAVQYALYLAIVGLPLIMRCRPDRAMAFALIAGVCAALLFTMFAGVMNVAVGFGPMT